MPDTRDLQFKPDRKSAGLVYASSVLDTMRTRLSFNSTHKPNIDLSKLFN